MIIGTYRATLYRRPARERLDLSANVSPMKIAELGLLEPLLVKGVDHKARLLGGDVCLVYRENERPLGLTWLNLQSYTDRHYGRWARPSELIAYDNQLFVHPDGRGKGIGAALVQYTEHQAWSLGRRWVHSVVAVDNNASRQILRRSEAEAYKDLFGIRLGRSITLRLRVPHRA